MTPTFADEEQAHAYTTDYLRRLLLEAPAIRARLENPGGSVILMGVAASTEQSSDYSTVIGNDFHLDLLDAETLVRELPAAQRQALSSWAEGLTAKQAAFFYGVKPGALQRRRHRAVQRVAEGMAHVDPDSGGASGQAAPSGRPEEG